MVFYNTASENRLFANSASLLGDSGDGFAAQPDGLIALKVQPSDLSFTNIDSNRLYSRHRWSNPRQDQALPATRHTSSSSKPTLCQNPYLETCLGCDDALRLSLTCDTRFQRVGLHDHNPCRLE